jgi:hypothetical protein
MDARPGPFVTFRKLWGAGAPPRSADPKASVQTDPLSRRVVIRLPAIPITIPTAAIFHSLSNDQPQYARWRCADRQMDPDLVKPVRNRVAHRSVYAHSRKDDCGDRKQAEGLSVEPHRRVLSRTYCSNGFTS